MALHLRYLHWRNKGRAFTLADGMLKIDGISRWGDDDLTFVGNRWELLEVSICAVPADAAAGFRDSGDLIDQAYFPPAPPHLVDIRARMFARQRIVDRQSGLRAMIN